MADAAPECVDVGTGAMARPESQRNTQMQSRAGRKVGGRTGAQPRGGRKTSIPAGSLRPKLTADGRDGAQRPTGPTFGRVTLRLHSVECVDTTKEVDRDEVVLVGMASNAVKKNGQVSTRTHPTQIQLGKFKKGTRHSYENPKTIVSFAYGDPKGGWPRTYPAALLLVEQDEGKIGEIAALVADAIDDKLADALKAASATAVAGLATGIAAGAAAGSFVPLIGTAVGAAVGAGVTAAFSAIKKAKADDVFPPKAVPLALERAPAAAGEIASTRQTHVFSAHGGAYKLATSWSVE